MKQIITHESPDLDAIISVWLLKRFLQGWEDAEVQFVSAGQKLAGSYEKEGEIIEIVDSRQTIHVDTGLGKLDQHNTDDDKISAASLTLDYVASCAGKQFCESKKYTALNRMAEVVVESDHFKELFRADQLAYYHDFSLAGICDGLKNEYPGDHIKACEFIMVCLDALLHTFENRVWAEEEIKEKGITFKTRWGTGLAVETINDDVLKLGQLMGHIITVKRDPNHGFVRIKACPADTSQKNNEKDVDLTPVYEALRKKDPDATWYLHVSKKMLLNGSSKNPDSKATILPLSEIMEIIKQI